jgi:hypothetical protein
VRPHQDAMTTGMVLNNELGGVDISKPLAQQVHEPTGCARGSCPGKQVSQGACANLWASLPQSPSCLSSPRRHAPHMSGHALAGRAASNGGPGRGRRAPRERACTRFPLAQPRS